MPVAANAIDLCLAADVAGALGVTSDATVQRMVTAASRAIAAYCGRTFEKGTSIVEYPAGYGRPLLLLERGPVLSVASITERGATVPSTEYMVTDAGVFRLYTSWMNTARYAGNVSQSLAFHQGNALDIVVTYTAGYYTPGQNSLTPGTVTLPEDAQEAAILTACYFYKRNGGRDPNLAAESIGDWSVAYFKGSESDALPVPAAAHALLAPYFRYRAS